MEDWKAFWARRVFCGPRKKEEEKDHERVSPVLQGLMSPHFDEK